MADGKYADIQRLRELFFRGRLQLRHCGANLIDIHDFLTNNKEV